MVFQDPYSSLDPRHTVGNLIAEGPIVHGMSTAKALQRARELLELVGLDSKAADRYPHEFSGGQRQRIGLARALALDPEILVADEPVSALDVSVQEQVLRLLADIRERLGLTMLFITHDLRVAAQVCDSIAVMRHGEIVEMGSTRSVFAQPRHAYTRELLAAVPGRAWSERRAAEETSDESSSRQTIVSLPEFPFDDMSLESFATAFRAGRIRSREVTESILERIDALQPRMAAYSYIDHDGALARATAVDAMRAAGSDLGPLMGLPIALKDLYSVRGMPTNAGSRVDVSDLVPRARSICHRTGACGLRAVGQNRHDRVRDGRR